MTTDATIKLARSRAILASLPIQPLGVFTKIKTELSAMSEGAELAHVIMFRSLVVEALLATVVAYVDSRLSAARATLEHEVERKKLHKLNRDSLES